MEAFSLLKFWRINPRDDPLGVGIGGDVTNDDGRIEEEETYDEFDNEDSFFDLEFTGPGEDSSYIDRSKKDRDTAFQFHQSPNDVFYKGRFSPFESNSKLQSPISFLRSPPKLRVLMFFKKPKLDKTPGTNVAPSIPNRFSVKWDVEEFPIWSLLNRINSSKNKSLNSNSEEDRSKRFPKDLVQKYLKLIKPLYIRVSKRYSDNVKFNNKVSATDPSSFPTGLHSPSSRPEKKQGIRAPRFRVVCKLGKSRSASSAAGIVPLRASKRDDSLLLQHDGIQSAILHCKRSYSSSTDFPLLSRFSSEASNVIAVNSRNSSEDEKKRSSI